MVYYVRFLKTPRFQPHKAGSCVVSTLVCITTDLGDSFLSETVQLFVAITQEHTRSILHQTKATWKAENRELSISLGPFPCELLREKIVVGIGAASGAHLDRASDHIPNRNSVPLVISGWSAPFVYPDIADKLVERRICFGDTLQLNIWEETGNNIARHIW